MGVGSVRYGKQTKATESPGGSYENRMMPWLVSVPNLTDQNPGSEADLSTGPGHQAGLPSSV